MKETTTIHLGRQQFNIAVDAHKALRHYLAEIEKQPGVSPEVIEEVELRMAELLVEHGVSGEKVVLPEDVDFLRSQLGEPGDFKDEASDDQAELQPGPETGRQPKRFFRDPENAMIAGVASGLAAYTGIDAMIIRVVFAVATLASGAGIIAYILLWILAPEAKTPSDRLKMQGRPVTVDSIKELVERADIAGASQRAGRTFGRGIAAVLEGIAKVVLAIIGAVLTTAGMIATVWSIFAGGYLLFHGGQIGNDILFPFGAQEVWAVILMALTAVLVGFFLTIAGIAMISRKWRLPAWSVASLAGLLVVSAGLAAALGADTASNVRDRFRDIQQHQTRQLASFDSLQTLGDDVTYKFETDSQYYAEFNYLGSNVDTSTLKTTVTGGVLTVDAREFMANNDCDWICIYSDRDMTVTVHAPNLDGVKLGGQDNRFELSDMATLQYFNIEVAPASDNIADVSQARIGKLYIHNVDNCHGGEPLIVIDDGFYGLSLNERSITDNRQLSGEQSFENANPYNCIATRYR